MYKKYQFVEEIVDKDTDQLTELVAFVNHLEGIINTTFEGLSSEENFHVSRKSGGTRCILSNKYTATEKCNFFQAFAVTQNADTCTCNYESFNEAFSYKCN